jgi:FkbM family methyltransferase
MAARAEREAFFDAARAVTSHVVADSRWGTFLVATSDRGVGRKLFTALGRSEMKTLERAIHVIDLRAGPPANGRGTLVDVGANIGTTTVPALLHFGFDDAVAIEPDEENCRLLAANLALNGLGDRSRVIACAVSDTVGHATLVRHASNSGAHQLRLPGASLSIETAAEELSGAVDVPKTTLDELARRGEIDPRRVGLLWLDVQGHEGHVIGGGASLLERGVPVVFELSGDALRRAGRLEELVAAVTGPYTEFVDLRTDPPAPRPVETLSDALGRSRDGTTDFLLLAR